MAKNKLVDRFYIQDYPVSRISHVAEHKQREQVMISESDVNFVVNVILRDVNKHPEDIDGYYFPAFRFASDRPLFDNENLIKNIIFRLNYWYATHSRYMLTSYMLNNIKIIKESSKCPIYISINEAYVVDRSQQCKSAFVSELTTIINVLLDQVPGLYLTDNYYTNGGNENENQTNV